MLLPSVVTNPRAQPPGFFPFDPGYRLNPNQEETIMNATFVHQAANSSPQGVVPPPGPEPAPIPPEPAPHPDPGALPSPFPKPPMPID